MVCGKDPGTAICGYGLVDMTGNRLRPVFYGSILTDKDMLPELRLKKIYDDLTEIIQHFHPDYMSIEKLFFNRNVTTAIPVGLPRSEPSPSAAGSAGTASGTDPRRTSSPAPVPPCQRCPV